MSEVLHARLRDQLVAMADQDLDVEEQAWELLYAVLPIPDVDEAAEPIWWHMVQDLGICTNCSTRYADCACCVGCGGTDADIIGSHGYWCAL